jgi:hypothetical protein
VDSRTSDLPRVKSAGRFATGATSVNVVYENSASSLILQLAATIGL